jgi:hypothetical protein
MKLPTAAFLPLALAFTTAATFGCDKKKGDPAGGTKPATPDKPAAAAKLVSVDLSPVGPDWAGYTIQAPEGATVAESFGAGEVKSGDHFQLEIRADKVDIAARKTESDANDINKVKRYLVNTPDALVLESEVMKGRPEFHFVGNVSAGGKDFNCENIKGPTYTQADVEAMWAACQTIAKK